MVYAAETAIQAVSARVDFVKAEPIAAWNLPGVWNAHTFLIRHTANFVTVRRAQTQAALLEPTRCLKCIAR